MFANRRVGAGALVAVIALTTGCAVRSDGPQAPGIEEAVARIEPALLRGHLQFLSDDLLRGRGTSDVGYEIAAEYVAAQYARIGPQPIDGDSYLQPIDLLEAGEDRGSSLDVNGLRFGNREAVFTPDWTGERPEISGDGVFVGYGLPYEGRDDYGDLEVEGAVVFVLSGAPEGWVEDARRAPLTRLQAETAYRRGAAAVVQIPSSEATERAQIGFERRLAPRRPLRALVDGTAAGFRTEAQLSPAAAEQLWDAWGLTRDEAIEMSEAGSAARAVGPVILTRDREANPSRSWNVIGLLPGSDPEWAGEVVLLTAHLDHVGIGEPDEDGDAIYNGTHDNALGIAQMLATAEVLSEVAPRRSIGFIAAGAEEGGLLGSWHYVRDPILPIESTVAVINQDGGLAAAAAPDEIYAFGDDLSTDLRVALDAAAATHGLSVVSEKRPPFGPSQMLLFRSDHYSFVLAGVPAIYLMPGFSIGGNPEAGRELWLDYLARINHRQRDNYDPTWGLESPVTMAGLSARLAWQLANGDAMPHVNEDAPVQRTRHSPQLPWFLEADAR
ncbi:MAG: M28 family peptidase [Acidobacteria bacterium]|nr:M28 family peptidase [Acidobacteriota bacterium]